MFISYLGKQVEYAKIPTTTMKRLWKKMTFQPSQVVYLHGFCDPFQNHTELLQKIAGKGYDVYAINLPGHMQSEKWDHVSWEGLINLMTHFFYELKINNPILVGFSLGGGISLQLASIPHLNINSLKLIAPFCYSLNALSPKWIDNFLHAALDTVNAIRTTDKHLAQAKVSLSYVIPQYKHLFSEYRLQPEEVSVPTTVLLLEKDQFQLPRR